MNVVLFGATRGIGRAIGRRLAGVPGHRLVLLGRDLVEVERSAADLELRGGSAELVAAVGHCDLLDPSGFAAALDLAWNALGGRADAVIVTAGMFGTQAELEADRERCRRMLEADFYGTVLFCEAARERLLGQGGGTLCVLSSVAGDRGRSPVVLYGAAKAGLSAYLEGLDHRYRRRGLRTVCIKPGFVRTSMTEGLPTPPFAADPDAVAAITLRAVANGSPVVYAGAIWRWVMLVVRALPRFVMRRVGF